MNNKEFSIFQSLLSKLSAVRITLSDDEQTLLDRMVLTSRSIATSPDDAAAHNMMRGPDQLIPRDVDEVEAHSLSSNANMAKSSGADDAIARGLSMAKSSGADEVEAHSLSSNANMAKSSGADDAIARGLSMAKSSGADEVEAHSLSFSEVRVIFDAEAGVYRIVR